MVRRAVLVIRAHTNKGEVSFVKCDVSDLRFESTAGACATSSLRWFNTSLLPYRAVRDFAEDWKQQKRKLHVLINNAGTALPPHTITKNGFEVPQMQ